MDQTTETIVDFVLATTPDAVSKAALDSAKLRTVDAIGCAFGAIDSPPARIARRVAAEVSATRPATVIGSSRPSSVENAVFANTVTVRYLDYNDMYFSPRGGGGHPSDLIATSLAVGEALGSNGLDVLLSIVASYEVLGALIGVVRLRERGWDQGLYTCIASAMAAGKLFGLSRDELGHAVSLAVTPHVPTRQTRVDELSMWKGCATAEAARTGVFAAILASKGMTGPSRPFEGGDGIWQQVTGPFALELRSPVGRALIIENIHTKYRPAEYNSQAALDLIVQMREEVAIEEIERIEVGTYWLAFSEIGSEPAKWDPQTRETADHSLPYLLAVALVDGDVGLESFSEDRVRDPRLRPLMQRIRVSELPEFTARFPAELPCRITIVRKDGGRVERETSYPHGHARNPLDGREMDAKFEKLVSGLAAADANVCRAVRDNLRELERFADIRMALAPLRSLGHELPTGAGT